ncbi:DUF397 domain-containing protein [Streptomyces noursei]|uniref:DUF397 domain-containing protein n=1 Tax=Streptomyces noursei TaxID=1971 RepID=UPI0038275B06
MPLPPAGWHKSSYSNDFEAACVEVSVGANGSSVSIRDSKDPNRCGLDASAGAWTTFVAATVRRPAH